MERAEVKILVVGSDPALRQPLCKWLVDAGYEVTRADNGRQAVDAINVSCPNMILTDWDMPVMNGLDLCRWLRAQNLPNYVYTIFIADGSKDMVCALETGADDFLRKPIDHSELVARVCSGVRILELETRLTGLAKSDPLTGLATRRTFFELVEREWQRSGRHHVPISCVMIDIDFFKRINDMHGHKAGDETLRGLGRMLRESTRVGDIVGRYGGEEFCILLPETTEEQATEWAERVRGRINAELDFVNNPSVNVTASFGVAQRLADTRSAEALVDLADQALLVAKRSGRDRVVSFRNIATANSVEAGPNGPEMLLRGLVASDVMTTVLNGLNEDETVGRAAMFFLRFQFHSAPIVDEVGQVVGILSERDVMSMLVWPNWWSTKIKDVMKRSVVCYAEDTSVLMIYEFLCRVSIEGVVVVKDGQPTGLITRGSLLRWFMNKLAVDPSSMIGGSMLEFDELQQPGVGGNALQSVAAALAKQTLDLERRLRESTQDLAPVVVGGISRIEELINDLLTLYRFASAEEAQRQTATASPLDTMIGIGSFTNDAAFARPVADSRPAARCPPLDE